MSIFGEYITHQNGIFQTHISKIIEYSSPNHYPTNDGHIIEWEIFFKDDSILKTFEILKNNNNQIEKVKYGYEYERPSGFFFFYELDEEIKYLFCWDKILGNDKEKLIEFFKQDYDIDLVKRNIIKIDDETINASFGNNVILLKLYDEKTKLYLKIDGVPKEEFIVKEKNDKFKIYKKKNILEKLYKPKYHLHVGVKKEHRNLVKKIPEIIEHDGPHYKVSSINLDEIIGIIIENYFSSDKDLKPEHRKSMYCRAFQFVQ